MTDRKKDVTDLLVQEIEEDLKREQYAKLWKKYGGWVMGLALIIVVGVAGFQGWKAYRHDLRSDEAQAYAAATAEAAAPQEVAARMAGLSEQAKTGYRELAALRRAALLAEAGDAPAAARAYDTIAADPSFDAVYRDLATLRSVLVSLDTGDPATLEGRLQTLTAGPWRHAALELTAVLARKKGQPEQAREIYERLADDLTAPQGVRARAAEMLAALGGPGQKG